MKKYIPYQGLDFPGRTWPSKSIVQQPIWCSVDLRDGNQALANPMNPEQKMNYFKLLVAMGFKEIEISFPSASKDDFEFTKKLIDQNLIPEDCTIQILTQARDHLIKKSFEAINGCKRAIVHFYNSTSPAQREIVFKKSRKEIIDIAVDAAMQIRDLSKKHTGEIVLQYSPESFSQTEIDFACEICNSVVNAWEPQANEKVIINFPSTVEVTTPNIFADQIEYAGKHLDHRENIILSVHTHNDRGCAVAAAEMALQAGADRVEGTLFGNGERTGNADLITIALNLYSQGIDPGIDVFNISHIQEIYELCTGMSIHPRHPYAGELVFTAFSGSHQDAISKGLANYKISSGQWNVPYLPIDPSDIGRSYDAVIRINSQSGKGGAAFIMESSFAFQIPKEMHPAFGATVQKAADIKGSELTITEVKDCFYRDFIDFQGPLSITNFSTKPQGTQLDTKSTHAISITAEIKNGTRIVPVKGNGNGIIDAMSNAFNSIGIFFSVISFHEHSISGGSDAKAVAYITIEDKESRKFYGAGIDTDIAFTSLKALVSAINRMIMLE
jgi:2-isopropylmalate synthase